jgi:SAM-dependent methyltransferase
LLIVKSLAEIGAINQRFYDALWERAYLQRPERFNTWPLVSSILPNAPARLEIGPGLRPRLPIEGTYFVDISEPAVQCLNEHGGIAQLAEIGEADDHAGSDDTDAGLLQFPDQRFDLVSAFDIIEHVEDDRRLFPELSRVLKDSGTLLCSVPVHASLWTEFDDVVGHARRYEPSDLVSILTDNQLTVEKSAVFGMQPASPRLVEYGMSWLVRHRDWAMFWYNWVGMPLAMKFQKRLTLVEGLLDAPGVDELLLVCRRRPR